MNDKMKINKTINDKLGKRQEAQGTSLPDGKRNVPSPPIPLVPDASCQVPSSLHPIKSYKDLLVWQKGMLMTKFIYTETQGFPDSERYGLTNQIRRAAVSVPSNIAEGYGRNSTQDYLRFLRISVGFLYEIQTQLEIAQEQQYLTDPGVIKIVNVANELEKMLVSMIRKISQNRH